MGFFSGVKIVRGIQQMVEGTLEGDPIKIVKGVVKTATGAVTQITGGGDSSENTTDDVDGFDSTWWLDSD